MINRDLLLGWPIFARPSVVVHDALSALSPFLVSCPAGSVRDRFAESCAWEANGKRILFFAPDEEAAEPIRNLLNRITTKIEERKASDRLAVARTHAERMLADAERELVALRATTTVKPGFFARLFGSSGQTKIISARISEWDAKRAAAEAELQRMCISSQETLSDCRSSDTDGMTRKSEHERRYTDISHTTPIPYSLSESLTASMIDDRLASNFDPTSIRIALPADLPLAEKIADLTITLAAERVTPEEFQAITCTAPAHILMGDPTTTISNSPYRNGVPTDFRSELFADLWNSARQSVWSSENGRIVCRLDTASNEQFDQLINEPVIDCPEIELRFLAGEQPKLSQIVFPAFWTAAQCRKWLATELGESRIVARGPAEWSEQDDIRVSWNRDGSTNGEWIETIPGVRECVVGKGADAITAELRFDNSLGWTRESAEAWVDDQLSQFVPNTVELHSNVHAEPKMEYATAG